jgi:hypothetical protein
MATRDGASSSCGPNGGLLAQADAIRTFHEAIVLPSAGTNAPGQAPGLGAIGPTLVAEFTLNTDIAYRLFKIPSFFVGNPFFEAHWTKQSGAGGDGNQSVTNSVRWRLSYNVFAGAGDDLNVAATVIDIDDTYDDAGTTTRISHATGKIAAVGLIANYYLGLSVESVTPGGSALGCEPALITIDLEYDGYINQ